MNKVYLVIGMLAILLVVAGGYIIFDIYAETQIRQQISIFQQGFQAGYEQAVIQLLEKVSTCQEVPVWIGNQSINVVAADCLK